MRTFLKPFAIAVMGLLISVSAGPRASADEPALFGARAGLDLAHEAADAWARDAVLVYIENDEDLDAQGAAARWSYLFYSSALDQLRFYSVRAGKILVAENLN